MLMHDKIVMQQNRMLHKLQQNLTCPAALSEPNS